MSSMRQALRALGGVALLATLPALVAAQSPDSADQPIDLSGASGNQSLGDLTGETAHPLQITGFAVGDNTYDQRTNANSFAASTIALALFRELSDDVWFFGQLTTSLNQPETPGGEAPTEIEIDNLIVNFTPPGASNLSLAVGKFDDPLGFERDDAPLNLLATPSYNYALARPGKFVGAIGRWVVSPAVDLAAWVDNGWDASLAPNHGKSGGARFGFIPSDNVSVGLGGVYGPEGVTDSTTNRYAVTLDYAFQPVERFILAGEANWGGDRHAKPDGSDTRWYGANGTLFGRLARHFALAVRGEAFNDRDGARTGTPQTLESVTVAPIYLLGTGREGIFANVEHTTFRIPRFQIRAEARFDHSNVATFATQTGTDTWTVRYDLQLVATF